MTKRIALKIEDNMGYSADQIETDMTVGQLIELLQEAAERHGEDALLVLDNGQRYGAQFGRISSYDDQLTDTEGDEEEAGDDFRY